VVSQSTYQNSSSPQVEYHEIEDYKRISELPDGAVVLSTGDPMLSGLGRFAKAGDAIVPGISSMQVVSAIISSVFSPQSPIVVRCGLAWTFECTDLYSNA